MCYLMGQLFPIVLQGTQSKLVSLQHIQTMKSFDARDGMNIPTSLVNTMPADALAT